MRSWLSQIPDGPPQSRGITLGRQSAAAILALRAGDGWDFQGTYTFSNAIGAYQTTPPWNGFVFQPGFRYAKPFGLRTPDQFRPAPPPRLDSAEYAAAYNEVKDFGRVDSAVRTPDQTLYAIWWMEFAEGSVNRLARQLVTQRKTHLWQAARMFALLNMSLFDGYHRQLGTPSTSTITGVRTRPSGRRPSTATRPRRRTRTGSRSGPLRRFRIMCPPTPRDRRHDGDSEADVRRQRVVHDGYDDGSTRKCRRVRSAASVQPQRSARTRAYGWAGTFATPPTGGLVLGRAVAGWLEENYLEFRGGSPKD